MILYRKHQTGGQLKLTPNKKLKKNSLTPSIPGIPTLEESMEMNQLPSPTEALKSGFEGQEVLTSGLPAPTQYKSINDVVDLADTLNPLNSKGGGATAGSTMVGGAVNSLLPNDEKINKGATTLVKGLKDKEGLGAILSAIF